MWMSLALCYYRIYSAAPRYNAQSKDQNENNNKVFSTSELSMHTLESLLFLNFLPLKTNLILFPNSNCLKSCTLLKHGLTSDFSMSFIVPARLLCSFYSPRRINITSVILNCIKIRFSQEHLHVGALFFLFFFFFPELLWAF